MRDLTVRYGSRTAVDGVTVQVWPGTVTALVGGDGAGKTTVLRALAGAVRPAAGTVSAPGRRQLGYVSARSGIYQDLTVDANLAFSAAAYRLARAAFRDRAEELLARIGLTEARSRLAGQLSGGMRQKLALACALLHRPQLLVLDEPTTGLDPVSRAELWRLLTRSAADGAAVLLSTTYLDEAERAGSVVVLDAGRQLTAGPPDEIIARMPGAVVETTYPPSGPDLTGRPSGPDHVGRPAWAGDRAWRRGRAWRAWSETGTAPEGSRRVPARLEDAVIVAALSRDAAVEAGRAAHAIGARGGA